MSELDQILAEHSALASAGAGQFTVDPRRQRDLLARLGLQSTAQGFLKLCQGIHRSGATRVQCITSGKNSLQIAFFYTRLLPEPLWDPGEPLGLALLNLSQEYAIHWEWNSNRLVRVGCATPDRFETQAPTPSLQDDCLMILNLSRPDAKWWHRGWAGGIRSLLASRVSWNPQVWTWDGHPLPIPPPLSSRAQAVIFADGESPGDLLASSAGAALYRRARYGTTVEEEKGLEGSPYLRPAHAILGLTGNSWSETFFVLDGVLLEGERNLLDRPGVVAVVSADGLTPSLSGLELVHDAAFRQRLQGLRPEVSWLDGISQRGRTGAV